MFDQESSGPEPICSPPAAVGGLQISLSELFFVVTLVAVELGFYLHVSSLLAFITAAGLLLTAVIRFADIHNVLLGSMVGYTVVFLVTWVYVLTCGASLIPAICTLIYMPACGYFVGGMLAESQNLLG